MMLDVKMSRKPLELLGQTNTHAFFLSLRILLISCLFDSRNLSHHIAKPGVVLYHRAQDIAARGLKIEPYLPDGGGFAFTFFFEFFAIFLRRVFPSPYKLFEERSVLFTVF